MQTRAEIRGGMCGRQRDTIDKFYTKATTVEYCISKVKEHILITDEDLIIEPSAGNGAFIEMIKGLGATTRFCDIKPEHKEIEKKDYLEYIPKSKYRKIHVIGNPPFGRQASTAIKFIKHSATFCDTISFILPKSFNKESMQKAFDTTFHSVLSVDIDNEFVLSETKTIKVPCVFQIWERRSYNRQKHIKEECKGFEFVTKNNSPHLSIRRVGVNAGNVDTKCENKNPNTNYFIKLDSPETMNTEMFGTVFNLAVADVASNTVGARSISKPELIHILNEIFQDNSSLALSTLE